MSPKKIGKILLGEPKPIDQYRRNPRRRPQTDWEAILGAVPEGTYRELKKEDGTDFNSITVMMALRRLVTQGAIVEGEFKARTQKRPDGSEATLLFHYGSKNVGQSRSSPTSTMVSNTDLSHADRISNVVKQIELNNQELKKIDDSLGKMEKTHLS